MTVQTTIKRADYTGNDVATAFNIPFFFLDETHLRLIKTDTTVTPNVSTDLVLASDYAVTGAGVAAGGTATLTVALPTGFDLAILRNPPLTQLRHYVPNDPFPAASHEGALDLLTTQVQMISEIGDRALVLPPQIGSGVSTELPALVPGYALGVNGAGDAFVMVPNTGADQAVELAAAVADFADTMDVSKGDAMLGVKSPYTGSAARTQHQKNQDILTSLDFTNLAAAISGIGAAKVTLVVMSPVSVTADLTIPANVTLRVEGDGLITVTAGKRIFINGPFQASRLQKCFTSSLLSTAITASINGNALVVTATAANALAEGHVISGTNVLRSQIIAAAYGLSGVGTYNLSSYNGIIASEAMTAVGPSVIFDAGTVECVYPQWWGAIADGATTDNRDAIAQAVYSMPWGGRVHFPAGSYKSATGGIVLHPMMQITGDGATDNGTGSPPNAFTVPSYVWLAEDNSSLFVLGGNCSHCVFKGIAFGAQESFGGASLSPVGTNRKAIVFDGHAGQTIYGPKFEDVWFFNLAMGVLVYDSWGEVGDGVGAAGTYWNGSASVTYYDWAVNPGSMSNCHFVACTTGVQFSTSNADGWVIKDSVFILPANSFGVKLTRCGYLKLDNCFAFGTSMTASKFVDLAFSGVGSADALVMDNCQAEDCANFLNLETSSTNDVPPTITVRNSIHQMGADISLGRACDYISQGNGILSYVYAIAAGVRIHSFVDKFFATDFVPGHATWGFNWTSGGDANTVYTYVPGYYPNSSFSGPISMGLRTSYGTAAPVAGTWAAGDRMVYSPPTVGQPKAWSCTVAGTPGTWVSEGNL